MPQKSTFLATMLVGMTCLVMGSERTAEATVTTMETSLDSLPHAVPESKSDLSSKLPVLVEPVPVEEELPEISSTWKDIANTCETFTAFRGSPKRKDGKLVATTTYRRNRYQYTVSDRERTREIIRLVAKEMGVEDPDIFVTMATHESSLQPETVHILNGDLRANRQTWARHDYTPEKETALRKRMAEGKDYWKAKAALGYLETYKANPHWGAKVSYDLVIPPQKLRDGTMSAAQTVKEHKSVWQYGYGLYGHNAVYYTKAWSREAAPWILCAHQGIISTIVEVWVARDAAVECAYLSRTNPEKFGTEGATHLGVLRRLATGKCGKKKLNASWQKLIDQEEDVAWSAKANFGSKWSQNTTDRQHILEHMLKRAEEEGLLRQQPLERKEKKPAIVAKR